MQISPDTLWPQALDVLRSMLNADLYNLWFAPIRAIRFEQDHLTLSVADDFCEVWLKDNYLRVIEDVLAHVSGQQIKVKFHVGPPVTPQQSAATGRRHKQKPQDDAQDALGVNRDIVLNPKCTFDTFVVGSNNSFAHAAALAVAQSPGKSYNPLFCYGGTGLGKTHLLNAIGQYVIQHRKNARVAFLSSEKFTNEYIDAIQNSHLVRFRKKYRQTDVLLIDDVQFLAGKERIQEEFFHTFNALHEAHKQIVLMCDRPANEIQNLAQRLISRLEWGLVTDLQPPDTETRMAILRKKAKAMAVEIPEEIIQLLAGRIRSNIRRLEGALIRVTSYVALTGGKPTIDMVENLLREVLQEEGRYSVNIEQIQKRVAEHFDVRLSDIVGRRRPENIAFPRQIAMFLVRNITGNSLSAIGEAFGGRDHGTVLHACRLVKDRMEVDDNVRQVVNYLEKQLRR